ncbi:MAG: FAD-binding protein [Pirellulales bacterium]|nr:FAD-binding protein [Pirellulales bacterium]
MYDLAIIGAGPAGATFARLVGEKFKVLLVDCRGMTEGNAATTEKCCGGLLAPDAQRMLSRFGLGLPKHVLAEPQLFVVQAIDIPRSRKRLYQRFYLNLDRLAFDRWLIEMVPCRVERRFGCRFHKYAREPDGFRIELSDGGRQVEEKARILVAADGAFSSVRRQLEGRPSSSAVYTAVQEHLQADSVPPYFTALFDPALTDYYCWTIPKDNCLVVGGAFRPQRARESFSRLKEQLLRLGYRWGETLRREAALLQRPRKIAHLSAGRQGIALLGEAGGWISPSSAEGFSYAFRTALALAEALHPGVEGFQRRYRHYLRPLAWNIFLKNLKARAIFHPTLRSLTLRSGWRSVHPQPQEAFTGSPAPNYRPPDI